MQLVATKILSLTFSTLLMIPLLAQAKDMPPTNRVSIEKARATAIQAYSGKIQGEELEFEGGKWIYSFDLKEDKDKRIHEVHIDAISGKLLNVHTETPADEKKELLEDQSQPEATSKSPLTPSQPISIPGKVGAFDFMQIDSVNHRLLAAHSGAQSLVLLNLKNGKLLPSIAVGTVQGIAIDSQSGTYILGDADEQKIVFVSSKTLKKTGELSVDGPVDAIAFDPKNGLAYAGEDDGSHIWVVDVKTQKIVKTITLPGVPEYVEYDPVTDRIYQNIKTKNSVVVINPTTNEIEATSSTLPVTSPHGLAVDGKAGHLYIAGHNGKLVGIDLKTGKVFAQADIAMATDQISLDQVSKIIYTASKGFISAVKIDASKLNSIGNTPSPKGAHTIAVDTNRHQVWVSFADKNNSYLQKFTAIK